MSETTQVSFAFKNIEQISVNLGEVLTARVPPVRSKKNITVWFAEVSFAGGFFAGRFFA
jgi:hypothetical protein